MVTKALKTDKTDHSINYLGITIQEYRDYLESKFEDGMSWDNYGEWQIDHIIPLRYDKEGEPTMEDTIKRLHYTNTQPLWAEDNMSKGNRRIGK
jgi:hypothetical protein